MCYFEQKSLGSLFKLALSLHRAAGSIESFDISFGHLISCIIKGSCGISV